MSSEKRPPEDDIAAEAPPAKRSTAKARDLQTAPTIYLDEDGDLRLRTSANVEPMAHDFVVCSRALSRSSKVWRAMLGGPFLESKASNKSGEWIIELPEDKSQPLLVLLNIIHGRFGLVPRSPKLVELHDILVVADKYDMVEVLKPWAVEWRRHVGSPAEHEKGYFLDVVWHFGDVDAVRDELYNLLWVLDVKDGKISFPDGLKPSAIPQLHATVCFDTILESRNRFITATLKQWHAAVEGLLQGNKCSTHMAYSSAKPPFDCGAFMLGQLKKHEWKNMGGNSLPHEAREYQGTVKSLYDFINSAYIVPSYEYFNPTTVCLCKDPVPQMQRRLTRAAENERAKLVNNAMKSALERNRARTGNPAPTPKIVISAKRPLFNARPGTPSTPLQYQLGTSGPRK